MSKFDVVTLGAAVQDVFLSGKVLNPKHEADGWVEEFPLGAKLDVDDITFSTGGGATNAAVTFARQGLHTGFMGKIGNDPAGAAVKTALMQEKIDISNMTYSQKYATGYSVLLLAPNGERTILTYRGASTHYRIENFGLDELDAGWVYMSSMSGNIEVLEEITQILHKKGIKIAINPGKGELKHLDRFRKLLTKFSILSLNKEEWQMLIDSEDPAEILRTAMSFVDYAVLTDGPNGSWVSDGHKLVKAGMYEDVPVVDRTGAGDAFCSGFVSTIIKGGSLEEAITFGSANSTSVVKHIGAKQGIMSEQPEHGMELEVTNL